MGGYVHYGRNTVDVDILSEEELFGEVALLEQATRAATVVTLEETELVEINEAPNQLSAPS
jgi:CRP-like cAMP-binding protein